MAQRFWNDGWIWDDGTIYGPFGDTTTAYNAVYDSADLTTRNNFHRASLKFSYTAAIVPGALSSLKLYGWRTQVGIGPQLPDRYEASVEGAVAISITASTLWTLQSPDLTIWTPSISTLGVVTWTSGAGSAGVSVILVGDDGSFWTPAISNAGVVTRTSDAVFSGQTRAVFRDSDGITWYWFVTAAGASGVSTLDTAAIVTLSNSPGTRHSLMVKYNTGGAFTIQGLRALVQVDKQDHAG